MKGIGRYFKGEGKAKGGLKVHMLTDIHADTPQFVKISEEKMHDKNFLQYLSLPKDSIDKAYNYYLQFAKWTVTGVNFVCRLKDNAKCEVQDAALFEKNLVFIKWNIYTSNYSKTLEINVEEKKKTKNQNSKKYCVCVWFSTKMIRVENTGLLPIIGI